MQEQLISLLVSTQIAQLKKLQKLLTIKIRPLIIRLLLILTLSLTMLLQSKFKMIQLKSFQFKNLKLMRRKRNRMLCPWLRLELQQVKNYLLSRLSSKWQRMVETTGTILLIKENGSRRKRLLKSKFTNSIASLLIKSPYLTMSLQAFNISRRLLKSSRCWTSLRRKRH